MQPETEPKTVTCSECDEAIDDDQIVRLRARDSDGQPLIVCRECADAIDRTYQAETEGPDLVHGLLLGLIAGLSGALLWFWIIATTRWQLGLIAVALGYLVGKAVVRGTGGKRGRRVQLFAVGTTFAVMLFSEYLIGRYFVSLALTEQGYEAPPVLLPPLTMLAITLDALLDLPTLALWGMAMVVAYALTSRHKLERAR